MRYRISNENFNIPCSKDMNDLYRKFSYEFNNLFNANEIAKNTNEFNALYVSDLEFEAKINDFLTSIASTAGFCVGYTGIGKSTSIRYCLNLGTSASPITTTSKLNSKKRMIVFPTCLDGYIPPSDGSFDLSRRISAVCSMLEKKHPDLRTILKSTQEINKFYEYISQIVPHILEVDELIVFNSGTKEELIKSKLSNAMKHYPLEFCICKLKYYISQKCDVYNQLVILLDDIESLPETFQERVIIDYFHLFSNLQNIIYPEDADFRVNLLISVRPHTYRIILNGVQGRMLSSYAMRSVILKDHCVDLSSLFEKRFEYYAESHREKIGNIDSWKMSYQSLMLVNHIFDGKYKNMISSLCFYNIRQALAEYSKVLSNRFWIQGNAQKESAFSISYSDFCINNVTVIRAVGCGNYPLFTGKNDSIIPNFFYTTHEKDYTVQCLLVIKYFQKKTLIFPGGYTEYGVNAAPLKYVYEEWRQLLDEERVRQLNYALKHLFDCKILRKSILDFDEYQLLDTQGVLNENSRLYLSPKGEELLSMLENNSILFEMLRECAWRDYDGHNYSRECSYILVKNNEDITLYLDLLEYVDSLRQTEEDFFFANINIDRYEYQNIFGTTLAVEYIMRGVENSLRLSGQIYHPEIAKKYSSVKENILDTKQRLLDDSN